MLGALVRFAFAFVLVSALWSRYPVAAVAALVGMAGLTIARSRRRRGGTGRAPSLLDLDSFRGRYIVCAIAFGTVMWFSMEDPGTSLADRTLMAVFLGLLGGLFWQFVLSWFRFRWWFQFDRSPEASEARREYGRTRDPGPRQY